MSRQISRTEYTKALRIVEAYEAQQYRGKYQFLYWLEDDEQESVRVKWIIAKNIYEACDKFLKMKSSDTDRVDHEVFFNGQYIDISCIETMKPYLS